MLPAAPRNASARDHHARAFPVSGGALLTADIQRVTKLDGIAAWADFFDQVREIPPEGGFVDIVQRRRFGDRDFPPAFKRRQFIGAFDGELALHENPRGRINKNQRAESGHIVRLVRQPLFAARSWRRFARRLASLAKVGEALAKGWRSLAKKVGEGWRRFVRWESEPVEARDRASSSKHSSRACPS